MTLFHTPKGMYRNQMWASKGKRMFAVNTYQVYSQSMGWCVPTFTAAFQSSFSLLCTEGLLCCLKLRHFAIQFVILEPWPVIQRYANNVQFCASLHTCNASQLLEASLQICGSKPHSDAGLWEEERLIPMWPRFSPLSLLSCSTSDECCTRGLGIRVCKSWNLD